MQVAYSFVRRFYGSRGSMRSPVTAAAATETSVAGRAPPETTPQRQGQIDPALPEEERAIGGNDPPGGRHPRQRRYSSLSRLLFHV